jgi:hypothetical protein
MHNQLKMGIIFMWIASSIGVTLYVHTMALDVYVIYISTILCPRVDSVTVLYVGQHML